MSDLRQAAEAALDALESLCAGFPWNMSAQHVDAIHALHTALAQPEPQHYPLPDELYAASKDWRTANYAGRVEWLRTMYESKKREADSAFAMLAAQTPKAERRPMTDGEILLLADGILDCVDEKYIKQFARAIERDCGIGGSDE